MLFGPSPWIFKSSRAEAGYLTSSSSRRSNEPRLADLRQDKRQPFADP